MMFPREIDGLSLTFDSRAQARGRTVPKKVTVISKSGEIGGVLSEAISVKQPPFAVVDEHGAVRVVSAGGSGAIWTVGSSAAQDESVKILSAAMIETFNIKPAAKKAASKKSAAPKVVENEPWVTPERSGWVTDALGSDPF